MGQKVNPVGFRVGVYRNWESRWFAEKRQYGAFVVQDDAIRKEVKKRLYHASVSVIEIERPAADAIRLYIRTARPGIVIGKKGVEIEVLKKELSERFGCSISVDIIEVRKPETNAILVAENIAQQLERRVGFRRAMKKSLFNATKFGVKGIKICCAGRLGGAEIARTEWYKEGRVPLQTLRAYIDYGFAESKTSYGVIGIKVWIYHGESFQQKPGGGQE